MSLKRPNCVLCNKIIHIGSCVGDYKGLMVHQDCLIDINERN